MALLRRVPALSLLFGAFLLGCEQVVVTTLDVDRVDVSPPSATVRQTETMRFNVTILSRDGRSLTGRAVSWSSLQPAIASVDENGMVRGLTPGSATIQATSEGVPGTASITVTATPAIAATPRQVDFAAVVNGASPGDRTIAITNAGDGTLTGLSATIRYTAGQPTGWLSASLPATAPTSLVLSATQAGLALGTYTATVSITSSVASNSPVDVTVRLIVNAPQPAIALGATAIAFSAPQGGADPAQQSTGITNAGGSTLSGLTVTVVYANGQPTGWLTASLVSSTAPTTLTLRAATAGLAQGAYSAQVRVSSTAAQNSPQTVNVTFTVGPPSPALRVTPATLTFQARKGGANPGDSIVTIVNSGSGTIDGLSVLVGYTAGQPTGWLATQLSGTTAPTTLTVGARTGALDTGTYTATLTVTSAAASNGPQVINVTFQVLAPPPSIAVSQTAVGFTTTTVTGDPGSVSVNVTNSGGGNLTGLTRAVTYAAGEPAGWLSADLASTSAPTTLALQARLGVLTPGTYNAKVQLASPVANNTVDLSVTFTVAVGLPISPGAVTAVAISERRINVTWTDRSSDESHFDIDRSTNGTSWSKIGSVPTDQTVFADSSGLTGSTAYSYRVSACNAVGCALNTTPASATTAPIAPSGLSGGAASSTSIDLKWTDNSPDETGFPVERSSDGGATWMVIGTAAADATSFTDTNTNATDTYRYRVRACRNALCSSFSNEAVVAPQPPGVPGTLTATAVAHDTINLAWGAASGTVTRYVIERKTTSAGTYAALDSVSGTTLTFQNTGLTAATEYFYQVRACNTSGCSGFSNETSATTPALLPPDAPFGLTANTVSTNAIALAWNAPLTGIVTRYRIFIRDDANSGTFSLADSVPGTTLAYQSTGLTPATSYSYQMQACNTAGCSGFSNIATDTTHASTVTNLQANAVSATRVDVSWTYNGLLATHFEVERATAATPATYTLIHTAAASGRSYSDTGVIGNSTYHYRVRACTLILCSAWVGPVTATTPTPNTPTGVTATASPGQVVVAWQAPGGQTLYIVRRRTGGSGQPTDVQVSGAALSYTDTSVASGVTYTYQVSACTSPTTCSTASPPVTVTAQ